MGKRTEILTGIGIGLIVIGVFFFIFPSKIDSTDDYDIDPLEGMSLTGHYDSGERIEGYFTVLGGDEEIEFFIKNPYGVIIYNAGVVKSRNDFAVTTEVSGSYTLFFGNKQDSSKIVFLTRQIIITPKGLCLPIVVIGIGISASSILYHYQERSKKAKQTTE